MCECLCVDFTPSGVYPAVVQLGHMGSGLRFGTASVLMSTVAALVYTPQGTPSPQPHRCLLLLFLMIAILSGVERGSRKQLRLMFPRWLRTLCTFSGIYCLSVFLLLETAHSFHWPIYCRHSFLLFKFCISFYILNTNYLLGAIL